MLRFHAIEGEKFNVRSNKDGRVFVDKWFVAYTDKDGEIYMKSFEVKPGDKPNIPKSGTHKELNSQQYQF